MSNFPSTARVVIIGGGAVGASALYHLEVDYPMNYHVTGSIRLAHSMERMWEFERAAGMGRYQGMAIDMCSVNDLKNHYPFLEIHDLAGGLYDPNDGDIDPAQLTQALAKGARDLGANIQRFTPAKGVYRRKDEWVVQTEKGDITCEFVVNAAGYYAQRVAEWFKPYGGRTLPMMVMSHQYLLSEEIPEIESWSKSAGHKLPLLRDVDSSYYLRQEKYGLNLGPYENTCKAAWILEDDPMPEDFSFQLYPDDLDRIEWHIEDAMSRVPLLGKAGISKVINGPIPYAPDGNPLIGPMPGVPNAFEACVFTFGIAQGGGAGKVLAEWIIEGQTEWDMWSCDPRRYTDYTDQDYCNQKGMEVYGNEYAMHFPYHEWPAGRDKKISALHSKILELGGVMGAYNGWERANWFAKAGDDTSLESTHTWSRNGPWEQRIREECEAVRDACGVLNLPGFSRFTLKGDGASDFLRGFCTGALPKIGRMNLIYVADKRGRILTEMSCIRLAEESFMLITAATAQWHDKELIEASVPDNIHFEDVTTLQDTLIVTGPQSREILSKISNADLSLAWLTHQQAEVVDKSVYLLRVSFAGELGWEIHASNNDMPKIYQSLLDHGATPFGMYALNSLRLEKGYRAWKGDLSTDYSMFEGGLDRFVKLDKPQDFVGKSALLNERQQGSGKRFVTLIVDAPEADAPYMSTIWKDNQIVGETTSGGWGYRVNASIALGMVKSELAFENCAVQVEIYGKKYDAVVQKDEPIWDPRNERLRA